MAGPWEKYAAPAQPAATGPWSKYAAPAQPAPEQPAPGGVQPLPENMLPHVPPIDPMPAAQPTGDTPVTVEGLLQALPDGVRQGISMALGAPVDIVNNLPRVGNLLPGEQGFTTMTDNPVGGAESLDKLLRFGGLIEDYEPGNAAERVLNRVGEEFGATAVPLAGGLGKASGQTVAQINRAAAAPKSVGQGLAAQFTQPLAVNPTGALAREGAYAAAAGAGAGVATEMFGDNAVADTAGSIAGTGGLALASGLGQALWNLGAAAVGTPTFRGGVVDEAVADRLMNSSERLATQAADAPGPVDTQRLVDALRTQAPVENSVPGYRANVADRTGDTGLATLAYNVDANTPGAGVARRNANDAAIAETITGITPQGNPGRVRSNLQDYVDVQIAEALQAQDLAQSQFDDAAQAVAPTLPTAGARGSGIRAALADAYTGAQDDVRQKYSALDSDGTLVDPQGLVERATVTDTNLAPNDAKRFRPAEASTIQEMRPGDQAPFRETGLVNEFNRPIMAENPPVEQTVPLSDIMATRSGLTDDVRAARAAGQNQAARVGGQYVDDIDAYLEQALTPELQQQFSDARAARRNVADRFERPGTANAEVLRTREGGAYALDDSAVPGRYAQPDKGRLSDLKSLLAEAGSDPRAREGLADTVLADVQDRGLINKPQALTKYLGDRQVLLGEFPELRQKLEAAGAAAGDLDTATRAAQETEKRLTTPGRSPEASYLKYSEDRVLDSVRTVTNASDPRAATRQLIESAGTPEAVQDLRTALWEEVKNRGQLSSPNATGGQRWNGRVLRDLFEDPKFSAVAEELWADDPEDLANIKQVFSALAEADGSSRAKAVNTSGTGQAVTGKYDPSLSTASVASRARSVNRGQLSPTIAGIDLIGTWLRRKSAQVQSRAVDQITSEVVNNPGLAADLLERYNPATQGAYTRMLTQKWGVRAPTLLQLLDGAENEDPTLDAIQEE
jgi:hypothetical protein